MSWRELYPGFEKYGKVSNLDVGCGYGGLLIALSKIFPDAVSLGLEIRTKVSDYVSKRIRALRLQSHGHYDNVAVIRANAMRFLPNFFEQGQLERMFFLFPDPHFKKKKHKARIITDTLLTVYAHLLKIGGLVYIATDVPDLFAWMTSALNQHFLFERVSDERACIADPVVDAILNSTEEGHKVVREGRTKEYAVYQRIAAD